MAGVLKPKMRLACSFKYRRRSLCLPRLRVSIEMEQIVLVIHVIAAIGLIGFILIQHGKGAEVGASFGSGASQTLFGSQGSGSFLTRTTAVLVSVFFVTSLTLGYLASHQAKPKDLDELLKKVHPAAQKQDNEIPEVVPGINKNEPSN